MAVMQEINCTKCGEKKYESVPLGTIHSVCSSCLMKEANQKKLTHLKGLTALTLSKRIALIEEYIYDDKARYKEYHSDPMQVLL